MTRSEARAVAVAFLASRLEATADVIFLDSHVVETDNAWFFPWDGRSWIEDKDFAGAYTGNRSVRVDKVTRRAEFEQ